MKKLNDLLIGINVIQSIGATDIVVSSLQLDSRKVRVGDCFFAIRGTSVDGHNFISACIKQGATSIVCEELPKDLQPEVTYIKVSSSALAMGKMANVFFDSPSSIMKVVGVTGTNGKTSVATLLFRLFRSLGSNVGLLSTVQNQINETIIPSTHTTPDSISLHRLLKMMVDDGCEYCFMEVSSHAVDQRRIAGVQFAGAAFTNITHDHLDYHKTFDNYLKAKKLFFDELPATAFAITNADDRNGMVMLQNTKATQYTYSLKTPSDFKSKVIDNSVSGLQMDVDGVEMHTRLIGEFNAYNITLVYAIATVLKVDKLETLTVLSSLSPPEGRFDQVVSVNDKVVAIIDYAHTPDALRNVLQTINAIRQGSENVITVVGCGGDRDAAKRPIMAEIACKFSQQVILTSDNPRSENPIEILNQMNQGVPVTARRKVLTIADRREAIKTAVMFSKENDIILLAGKGHEKYQEVNGVKTHFDDKEEVYNFFSELEK